MQPIPVISIAAVDYTMAQATAQMYFAANPDLQAVIWYSKPYHMGTFGDHSGINFIRRT